MSLKSKILFFTLSFRQVIAMSCSAKKLNRIPAKLPICHGTNFGTTF